MRFLLALALAACTDFNPDAQTTTFLPEVDASTTDAAMFEPDFQVEEDAALAPADAAQTATALVGFRGPPLEVLELEVGRLAAFQINTTQPRTLVQVRFDDGTRECRPRSVSDRVCTAFLYTTDVVTDEVGLGFVVAQGLAPVEEGLDGPRLLITAGANTDSRAFRVVDPDF